MYCYLKVLRNLFLTVLITIFICLNSNINLYSHGKKVIINFILMSYKLVELVG